MKLIFSLIASLLMINASYASSSICNNTNKLNDNTNHTDSMALPIFTAIADSATTRLAIVSGTGAESNSIINTSSTGLVGLALLKIAIIKYADKQPPEERKQILTRLSGLWSGVVANNLLVLAGATSPISIIGGVIVGIAGYNYEKDIIENEYQKMINKQLSDCKQEIVTVKEEEPLLFDFIIKD